MTLQPIEISFGVMPAAKTHCFTIHGAVEAHWHDYNPITVTTDMDQSQAW